MKRLLTLFSLLAIVFTSNAQSNGKQIKSLKKELNIALKKNQVVKPKHDLNKISFASKYPLNQIHYEWSNNDWEFNFNSDINYHADGRKNSESLVGD